MYIWWGGGHGCVGSAGSGRSRAGRDATGALIQRESGQCQLFRGEDLIDEPREMLVRSVGERRTCNATPEALGALVGFAVGGERPGQVGLGKLERFNRVRGKRAGCRQLLRAGRGSFAPEQVVDQRHDQ